MHIYKLLSLPINFITMVQCENTTLPYNLQYNPNGGLYLSGCICILEGCIFQVVFARIGGLYLQHVFAGNFELSFDLHWR